MQDANIAKCQCGLDYNVAHCPHCGKRNFYALKDRISRPHPLTGVITEVTLFRCRGCNKQFDELQYLHDCKAPIHVEAKRRIKQQITQRDMLDRVDAMRKAGIKLDENAKRHFRRVVGYDYETHLAMSANIQTKTAPSLPLSPLPIPTITPESKPKIKLPFKLPEPKDFHENKAFMQHIQTCPECKATGNPCQVGQLLMDNPNPKL